MAREGLDLARFLAAEGARVRLTDRKTAQELVAERAELAHLDIAYSLGGHPLDEVLAADLIYVSPGISPDIPALAEARRRGITLSSATELFFARCPAPIVGITGSSGKSTTTALIGEMLTGAGGRVVVGGNIGQPLLARLPEIGTDTLVIMELSSFQLETLERSPTVAVITNVTPNHLDRHGTMAEYVAAKERIVRFQSPDDWAVLNADDPLSGVFRPPGLLARFSLQRPVEGAYLRQSNLWLELAGRDEMICSRQDISLRGTHNAANALAACATAAVLGTPTAAMRAALRIFQGLPHRLQKVGEVAGVAFYDDSIATSPERSMAGLASFEEPVILLAGGRDKHLPMDEWAGMIRQRASGVVLFGEARGLIHSALSLAGYPADQIKSADDLDSAVRIAYELARPGEVVLLSPGCTSYDMFADFVERGLAFAAAVGDLARGKL
jgi:UDP-N-acetylmuramoylalanine--D-glutamate ligase